MKTRAWEQSIRETLERLGRAVSASRVSIFENHMAADGTLLISQRFEWAAPGVTPRMGSPEMQGFLLRAYGFGGWVERMAKGEPVYGKLQDFPESEREALAPLEIRSIAAVPIFVEDHWWGFVGFDDCWTERDWSPADIAALRLAVATMGTAIERRRAELETAEELRTIAALNAGARRLAHSLAPRQVAESVVRTCVEEFGVPLAWVGQVEPGGSVRMLAVHPSEGTYPRTVTAFWDDYAAGRGPVGQAIQTGTAVVAPLLGGEPGLLPEHIEALLQVGLQALAIFPLVGHNGPSGALALYAHRVGYFDQRRVESLQELARQAAAALENARRFAETGLLLERLRALHAASMAVSSSLDLRVTLDVLLDNVVAQPGVDAAAMLVLNPDTQMIEHAAGRGLPAEALRRTRLGMAEGYAGQAALERRIISIPDLAEAAGGNGAPPWLRDDGFRAYTAVPLVARGQVKGVIEILQRAPHSPTGEWLEYLQALGAQAAVAIDNAALVSSLQRSHADLMLAYEETLESWARAVELWSKERPGRTRSIADLTVRLARAMGVPEADLVHIRQGALLHDIGNLGVPDSILHKRGVLTEGEREIMRHHPVRAYELLSSIPHLHRALDIPYCHHERWDGTGYPRGLRGEQIPLAARIFAVADAWDALRSARRDRPARTDEQARQYIRRQAGRHFDPRVVETFLQQDL
jgi:GAF domain-containing protein